MTNIYGFDPVAWSIDGGRHPADLLRLLSYAATGGAEGTISPGDCRVHSLQTPGGQVLIDPGALLIRNRSANVKNQTYVANGRDVSTLDIDPTTQSGPRSDLVVVRVEDPQYSPWPAPAPADAPTYQYVKPFVIKNVPPNTTSARQLNLGYSAYALARIDLPTNTATVTDSLIKNLRSLARPREQRILRGDQPPVGYSKFYYPSDSAGRPSGLALVEPFHPNVTVPEWATTMQARGELLNVRNWTGEVRGAHSVVLGATSGANALIGTPFSIEWDDDPGLGQTLRRDLVNVTWDIDVRALAGQTLPVWFGLRIDSGSIEVLSWSFQNFDLMFSERAV